MKSVILLLTLALRIIFANYIPLYATTFSTLSRKQRSSQLSFDLSPSQITDCLVIGYFNLSPTTQPSSLIRFTPDKYDIYVLHLYTNLNNWQVSAKGISRNYDNYLSSAFLFSTSSPSYSWKLFGIGYKPNNCYYLMHDFDSSNRLQYTTQCLSYSLFSSEIVNLCIGCSVFGSQYSQMSGTYSNIKILYGFQIYSAYSFYYNILYMSKNELKYSYSNNLTLKAFVDRYFSQSNLACSSGYTFFDGVCVIQSNCPFIPQENELGVVSNNLFYDSSLPSCNICQDNCSVCTSSLVCTQCDHGFVLDTVRHQCSRCPSNYYYNRSTRSCQLSCSSGYYPDLANWICVSSFDHYVHTMGPYFNKKQFYKNPDVQLVVTTTLASVPDSFELCIVSENSISPYTFFGGANLLTTHSIKKSIFNMPINTYMRTVSFKAMSPGNGVNIILLVNSMVIPSSKYTLLQDDGLCADSTQKYTIAQFTFTLYDILPNYDIQISSTVNGWGIRDLAIKAYKCHPSCTSCYGKESYQCWSCNKLVNKQQQQCFCQSGYYVKYKSDCYQNDCYSCEICPSYCATCFDITGKCITCSSNYLLLGDQCIFYSNCNNNWTSQNGLCFHYQKLIFQHFNSYNYGQYYEFWNEVNNLGLPPTYDCFDLPFLPFQAETTLTLNTSFDDYQSVEHYMFKATYSNKDSIDDNKDSIDYLEFRYNGMSSQHKQNWNLDGMNGFSEKCGGSDFHEKMDTFEIEIFYIPQYFSLGIYSKTDEPFDKEGWLIRDIQLTFCNYLSLFTFLIYSLIDYCYPTCVTCQGGSCQCIANAYNVGSICACNHYFYLTISPIDYKGICQPCNFACKICHGQSYLDCDSCREGYQKKNGMCVQICYPGNYWDASLGKCQECSSCCKECKGPNADDCFSCSNYSLMTWSLGKCYYKADNSLCTSCSKFSNGKCGGDGTIENTNLCDEIKWFQITTTSCVVCKTYFQELCGGNSYNSYCTQNTIGYIYNPEVSCCYPCSVADLQICGIKEIQSGCTQQGWVFYQSTTCIKCSINYQDPKCSLCHSSCLTCSGPSEIQCLICKSGLFFSSGYCLSVCPNGQIKNTLTQSCDQCLFLSSLGCRKCFPTCQMCSPFQISVLSNTCTSCYPSRILEKGRCNCRDPEDNRVTYFECSFQKQVVVDILLSNNSPIMTIEFGKNLKDIHDYEGGNSNDICVLIFDQTTLDLLGSKPLCTISGSKIIVTLGDNAEVFDGDILTFLPNVLMFLTEVDFIDKFLNCKVIQELPLNVQVGFYHNKIADSCKDFEIYLKSLNGDCSRKFRSLKWNLVNADPTIPEDVALQALFADASTNRLTTLIVPQGTVTVEVPKTIQLDLVLKNTYSKSIQFVFLFSRKSISSVVSKSNLTPFYRFHTLDFSFSWELKYCDAQGVPTYYSQNVNFTIVSSQMSALSTSETNYQQKNYIHSISPYTLNPSNTYQFNFKVTMSSNNNIYTEDSLELYVTPSPLIVKIKGGSKQIDYRTSKTFESYLRDRDMSDSTIDQQIIPQWACIDPVTQSQCLSAAGLLVNFDPQATATIIAGTFNPYTFVVLHLSGSKDTRITSTLCNVVFSEFDLPNLALSLQMIDPEQQTLNLNEEVFVQLEYGGVVNTDILSFSGTVVYELSSVGVIKFDYITFRFKLWNIYSGFKRSNPLFSLRFSVYNPNFFMPSSQILQFKINFPPDSCSLHFTQSDVTAIALSTIFTLEMIGCIDEDIPIKYQFFYFSNYAEMEEEIVNPSIVRRKQISDVQLGTSITSILPSGNLTLLALAIDKKQAISNCTKNITILKLGISEQDYSSQINTFLDSNNKTLSSYISQLSIVSQDLSQNPSFSSPAIIQQKKLIISSLKNSITQLPVASQFEDSANKAISSLVSSGVSFFPSEQKTQLNDMYESLGQQLPSTFTSLKKEQREQQLFDFYKTVDEMASSYYLNSVSSIAALQMSLTQRIADTLNENSLPNENSVSFKGNQVQITTQKITTKYLCAYYRCSSTDFQNTQQDDSASPSIYGISMVQYEKDPYYSDSSLLNYTTYLKNYTNETLTEYPFIIPSIKDADKKAVAISKEINLEFKSKGTKTSELSCLTKSSKSKWTQEGCKNVYSPKQQLFTCICSSTNPTTIVDDLGALIINKNLQTAFSQEGLSNISSWSNFYEFVAFWLILSETIIFILLLRKGKALDNFDSKYFIETSPQLVPQMNSHASTHNKISSVKSKNSILRHSPNEQLEQLKQQEELGAQDIEGQLTIKNLKASDSRQENMNEVEMILFNMKKVENDESNKEKGRQSLNNIDPFKDEKISTSNEIKLINFCSNQVESYNEKPKLTDESSQSKLSKEKNSPQQEEFHDQVSHFKHVKFGEGEISTSNKFENEKNVIETQSEQKEKDKCLGPQFVIDSEDYSHFQKVKFIKQILLFHNFFNIFFIYDPKLSRQLRFSIFYVRLIHSLAVSIVYAAQYTQAEMIAVSIFNAIIVTIVLKLLEFLTNFRTIGKKLASVFLSILLIFYYYLILSIVSGQDSSESNKSIGSFFIVFVSDLFVTATATAFAFRYLASYVLKKAGQFKFSKWVITFLKLQMILQILNKI